MGRRKIEIKRILDEKKERATFKNRTRGLMKKAMELSILCKCKVGLVVFDEHEGKVFEFNSNNESMLRSMYNVENSAQVELVTKDDYEKLFVRKEEDDSTPTESNYEEAMTQEKLFQTPTMNMQNSPQVISGTNILQVVTPPNTHMMHHYKHFNPQHYDQNKFVYDVNNDFHGMKNHQHNMHFQQNAWFQHLSPQNLSPQKEDNLE